MSKKPVPSRTPGETMIIGGRTREVIKGACKELADIGVFAAGRTAAYPPYMIRRERLMGSHVIATFDGEGEFHIDGAWQRVGEGGVFLAPAGHFGVVPGGEGEGVEVLLVARVAGIFRAFRRHRSRIAPNRYHSFSARGGGVHPFCILG